MVPNSSLAEPDKATESDSSHDHTTLDHAAMVSNDPGNARKLPTPFPSNSQPDNTANRSGHVHNETQGTGTSCMAYIRVLYITRNFYRGFKSSFFLLENKDQVQLKLLVYQIGELVSAEG